MKKLIITSIIFLSISLASFSQTDEYKSTVSVGVAQSLIGKLMNAINLPDSISSTKTFANPAFTLSYDYQMNSWFSLGLAFSTQKMGLKIYDYETINDMNISELVDFTVSVNRMNFAIRPLFHYGVTDKIDMYSGLRFGLISNKLKVSTEVAGFDEKDLFTFKLGSRPTFQIIPFGIRYNFNEHIGINGEVAIGSPYYTNVGMHFKF